MASRKRTPGQPIASRAGTPASQKSNHAHNMQLIIFHYKQKKRRNPQSNIGVVYCVKAASSLQSKQHVQRTANTLTCRQRKTKHQQTELFLSGLFPRNFTTTTTKAKKTDVLMDTLSQRLPQQFVINIRNSLRLRAVDRPGSTGCSVPRSGSCDPNNEGHAATHCQNTSA